MALADRVKDAPRHNPTGLPCSIGELERSLKGEELKAFQAMMYELGWSQARIWEVVTAEGHEIGRQTVNRHRSHSCRCFQ